MNDSRDLKAIAEACQQHQPLRFMRSHGALYIRNDNGIVFDVHQNRSFPEFMAQNKDYADLVLAANPAAVLALIAENEEYKAVAEQPASLNAVPATEYAVLKRQFFALRNYALCKDKLSGYYSRELEKLRGVDRSQSAGEIDAERDINEQLTNDLLTVETERDHLKAEVAGLKTGYEAYEQVNAGLKAEVEWLRKELAARHPFKFAQESPAIGFTGCVICGVYTDHGGLPCPKTRATAIAHAAMGKGERS